MIDRADQEIGCLNMVWHDRMEPLFQDRKKDRETRRTEHHTFPAPPEGRENRDRVEEHTHMERRREDDVECGNARKQCHSKYAVGE